MRDQVMRDQAGNSAAVGRFGLASLSQRLHFVHVEGLESARGGEILLQDLGCFHAADCDGYREAHRIAQPFLGRDLALANHFAAASETLHSERSEALPARLRQHPSFEAAKTRVETVERHLHCIERKIMREHPQVNRTLPCFFACSRASAAPPGRMKRSGSFSNAIQSSDFPRSYSQRLSKKVTPPSIASWTSRTAAGCSSASPR